MNLLLDLYHGWEEVLTLKREKPKECGFVISVQGGHMTNVTEVMG